MSDKRYDRRIKRLTKKVSRLQEKETSLADKALGQLGEDSTKWTKKQKRKSVRLMKKSHRVMGRKKKASEKLDETYDTKRSTFRKEGIFPKTSFRKGGRITEQYD
jgi:hypothetical protein